MGLSRPSVALLQTTSCGDLQRSGIAHVRLRTRPFCPGGSPAGRSSRRSGGGLRRYPLPGRALIDAICRFSGSRGSRGPDLSLQPWTTSSRRLIKGRMSVWRRGAVPDDWSEIVSSSRRIVVLLVLVSPPLLSGPLLRRVFLSGPLLRRALPSGPPAASPRRHGQQYAVHYAGMPALLVQLPGPSVSNLPCPASSDAGQHV